MSKKKLPAKKINVTKQVARKENHMHNNVHSMTCNDSLKNCSEHNKHSKKHMKLDSRMMNQFFHNTKSLANYYKAYLQTSNHVLEASGKACMFYLGMLGKFSNQTFNMLNRVVR